MPRGIRRHPAGTGHASVTGEHGASKRKETHDAADAAHEGSRRAARIHTDRRNWKCV
ncbi:hypothetical protein PSP6_70018 [Paraburkholderia tropica]|nr:hypothetical protein PSP6_70018 [Paraburkholderia tropica]